MFRPVHTRALMGSPGQGPGMSQVLGRFPGEGEGRDGRESFHRNRVVTPVSWTAASLSLFLHVTNFATGGHLAVLADHASASECGEAEKPDEAHHDDPFMSKFCTVRRGLRCDAF